MNHGWWYAVWVLFLVLTMHQFMSWGLLGIPYFIMVSPFLVYAHLSVYHSSEGRKKNEL